MKSNEIQIGHIYLIKHDGQLRWVRIEEIINRPGHTYNAGTYYASHTKAVIRYRCTNLTTGREVTVKSATKFRKEMHPMEQQCPNETGQQVAKRLFGGKQ